MWQAIEWKTYDRSGYGYEALNVEDDDDEEIPITEQIKVPPPPPPPPPAPEVIEGVEDEEEVEETVIESTETDQEEIVEVDEVEIEDGFDDVDVPFAVIGLTVSLAIVRPVVPPSKPTLVTVPDPEPP